MDHGGAPPNLGAPAPIGEAILDAIAARPDEANRRDQKVRLVERIKRTVEDPEMDDSVARRAAEAVVVHGYSADEFYAILETVRRKRKAGEIRTSAGAYFIGLLRRRGVPWNDPANKPPPPDT